MKLVNHLIVLLNVLLFANTTYAKIETVSLKSDIFQNERTLRIYLPTEYDTNRTQPYPVLYMNDGQNLFSADTSMTGQEWSLDETLDAMIGKALPPLIVVGIDTNSYADRANEYLPWPDEYLNPYIEAPNGKNYPAFLDSEVIPLIEKSYNVGKTAEYRALGGSSYGGLITLYTALKSESFSKLLIESPSLYVSKGAIFRELRRGDLNASKVYIGIGTHEGMSSCDQAANEDAVDDMRRAVELMKGDFKLYDVVEECGLHSEEYWARRVPTALIQLFQE